MHYMIEDGHTWRMRLRRWWIRKTAFMRGCDGMTGRDGMDGIPGRVGDRGKSAFEHAQRAGFKGNEYEFNAIMANMVEREMKGRS